MMKQNDRLEQTMRWYGPNDPVSLADIRMAGATGIVTALHHIPNGAVWPEEEIRERKTEIEAAGLTWSVVESVPVHDDIKTRKGNYEEYLDHYAQTLRNLGNCGIYTVCYNFMPVLDWTRTDLTFPFADGSEALAFNLKDVAVFDVYILKRKNAAADYPEYVTSDLEDYFESLPEQKLKTIEENILKGLPGSEESFTLDYFRRALGRYADIDTARLKENLNAFLRYVVPAAEESGVYLAIHPDDPPRPLFGLPRVVSDENDLQDLLDAVDSVHNGFTMCTGSYGVKPENDLPRMIMQNAEKMHFVHLRNISRDDRGNFHESDHLDGVVDMFAVMTSVLKEIRRRGRSIPMRPDHGHRMLDDLKKETYPGYTAIGRLRGLAELRGLEMGIIQSKNF